MDELIETVIDTIQVDLQNGDIEAVEELLRFVPVENLLGYLPEDVAEDLVKAAYTQEVQEKAWAKWLPEIQRLEKAMETNVWNPVPNFTCRKFCPVHDCEHNGKGSFR